LQQDLENGRVKGKEYCVPKEHRCWRGEKVGEREESETAAETVMEGYMERWMDGGRQR
jgi:hypothetical protein